MYRRLDGTKGAQYDQGLYFFYRRGNESHHLGTGFFVHRIVSAVKRVEFVSDRMPYTVLRGRWFNNIVLNIHATNEKKKRRYKRQLL